MNDIHLTCECGKVQGVVHEATAEAGNRIVCHCDDCQSFAKYLGSTTVLDENNGTDIYQTSYARVEITEGNEYMRSIRLKPKGLIRWYTDCCKTPIGNTISGKMPFIGIVHNFMDIKGNRDNSLGPITAHAFLKKNSPAYHLRTPAIKMLPRMMRKIITWKLRDSKKANPFFGVDGTPLSTPVILS